MGQASPFKPIVLEVPRQDYGRCSAARRPTPLSVARGGGRDEGRCAKISTGLRVEQRAEVRAQSGESELLPTL
jgi:hypothetical protein